jgi:hypothetical protein
VVQPFTSGDGISSRAEKGSTAMSKPTEIRFELHAIDERVKLLLLVLFGSALVAVVGFGLLVVWAG